eukprot:scaffold11130_cov183-Skeletonema_dohrnii-CCMP3373.AAC.1
MMLVWLQIRSVGIPYEIYVKAFVLLAAKRKTRGSRSTARSLRRVLITQRPHFATLSIVWSTQQKPTTEAGILSLARKGRTIQNFCRVGCVGESQ